MKLLLQSGWQVVDMKNRQGERAEVVAGRHPDGAAERLVRSRCFEISSEWPFV